MVLIIGGAYQGKLDYALASYGEGSVYRCADEPSADLSADIIDGFHRLVLAQLRNGVDTREYILKNLDALKSKIIISDDISCGVVPIDPEMRQWREAAGRSLALLAGHADEVVRVFCGLGSRIK